MDLTWKYIEESNNIVGEQQFIIPPQETLYELYNLALTGQIVVFRQFLDNIIQKESKYHKFTEHLGALAQSVKLKEIRTLLQSYLKDI